MKTWTSLGFALIFLASSNLAAQTTVVATPERWTAFNCEADFSADTIHVINTSRSTAFLWAKNIKLKNGIIELDIKGPHLPEESFVGVAFHGEDNQAYDAVYFRPFTFRNPEDKDRAVQYIGIPGNDWDILREKHPGKYEHAVVPDADPNNWFHVKIVIQYPEITAYVNGSNEPSLKITQLSKRTDGKIGLWVDSKEGWFKNVTVINNSPK
ncbi:MAG TPA: family 16 glycoside hydrolase [Cyclobacteriaceae bacterium]|nr:family 16 glycoside hydrolase [Cyclobacteriaceae bacterium]